MYHTGLRPQIMPKDSFVTLDQFEYHHQLAKNTGIALVIFTRSGCGSCNAWKELLKHYQGLHPAISLFEVDVEQEPGLAHELEIFHLPALFLYVDGEFHCQLQAEAKLSKLEQAIQSALASPADEQP